MKERPILFSAPMIRALLAGMKTQTRRAIKPQPDVAQAGRVGDTGLCGRFTSDDQRFGRLAKSIACPYGAPGDRLWVRETWLTVMGDETFYRADYLNDPEGDRAHGVAWKPSIHMHRARSRITLEITAVRVERLQDIWAKDADCMAEGIEEMPSETCGPGWRWWRNYTPGNGWTGDGGKPDRLASPGNSYRTLWESINGPGSWDANPWVWVVEFKRVEA